MSRSKNRKIADLISGTTFDDGVVAASEVTGLATVATSGSFSDLSNQPTPFDPSTLATVATSGAYSALSGTPSLGTASTQATGAFATAAQGTTANAALPKAGGAVTGNVTFGDNDKAVFGAGSDLQIYHNGGDSLIADTGAGDLYIRGSNNIFLQKGDGSETFIATADDGAVTLYNNNASKMSTTTSGIDVTGTVNADALTGIGSIDATTKNAIEAAGIGGGMTKLADVAITSNVSSIDYNFPDGYHTFRIILKRLAVTTTANGQVPAIHLRLKNSSGTTITSGVYSHKLSSDGGNGAHDDSSVEIGKATTNKTSNAYHQPIRAQTTIVDLHYPKDSSIATGFHSFGYNSNAFEHDNVRNGSEIRHGGILNAEANAGMIIYIPDYGNTISSDSEGYEIWGIK